MRKIQAQPALLHVTYLLTISCHGSHLPGEEGIVDKHHNVPRTPVLDPNPGLLRAAQHRMRQSAFTLGVDERRIVRDSIGEVCRHKDWRLLAAHVRTNHMHVVIQAEVRPEVVLNVLKSYASPALNLSCLDERERIRWVRARQHAVSAEFPGNRRRREVCAGQAGRDYGCLSGAREVRFLTVAVRRMLERGD